MNALLTSPRRLLTGLFLLVALPLLAQRPAAPDAGLAGREKLSLDWGWLFHPGDVPFPEVKGHLASYFNAKAGQAGGAAAPAYDDHAWAAVALPHDWAATSPFDSTANISQGYRARGTGWYRRHFRLDAADRGRHLELQFDGVATHCTVWVNGQVLHRNWSGYTSFYLDITALARYGDELNTVAVRVDAVDQEGWWYEGAGIYRHAWLVKRAPVHIMTDGVYAQPVRKAGGTWEIPAEVTLENAGKTPAEVTVETTLLDPKGREVGRQTVPATVLPLGQAVARLTLPVARPELWSVETPTLYQVRTVVRQQSRALDQVTTRAGFRTLRFDADSGFFLNGKPVKLRGTCNHQDHAGVGVAVPEALWEFRLKKLKDMGSNAYRCAHNPPAAEFLEACDRLGMLVMDENRNFNAAPEYVRQVQWLVRRDRNHPSVILWSVGNEELLQGTATGYGIARSLRHEVRQLDTTRSVTAAMNGGFFAPVNVAQALDVVGFNYQPQEYDHFHQANPTLPMTSSEDVSGYMQRGQYQTDTARHLLDAYDTQHATWGLTQRQSWKAINERPFVAGCFIWTGFDYHGEPSPFTWPTAGSNFGLLDLCGFPKMGYYLHQAQWVTDRPVLQLVPHWNWAGQEGQPIKVMALSNAETVRLLLNGQLIGEQKVDAYEMNTWQVPYRPGRLEARAYRGGREIARQVVETTGPPVRLLLLPAQPGLAGDGQDALPVTVQALDAKGRPVPTASLPVTFALGGPGAIIGLGNGDPNSHEAEKGTRRSLYHGLAQVIVQTARGAARPLELVATAPGCRPARLTMPVTPAAVAAVPEAQPALQLTEWRRSPGTATRPDPNQQLAASDMNSWAPVKAGEMPPLADGGFVVLRTDFTPYAAQQQSGGRLVLASVNGKAEVWLNQQRVATKTTPEAADMVVELPPHAGRSTVSLLLEAAPGQPVGLGGVGRVLPAAK